MSDRRQKTTFDAVAALYDRRRPSYPASLVADVIALSGIGPEGHILEIGCGTGKATLPFARRGYRMLCLELGENLAKVAAANLAPYPQVTVQQVAFEAWPLQAAAFDLVLSAQAFHWLDPALRLVKSAAALRPSGTLALFWNQYPPLPEPLGSALEALYRELAPALVTKRTGPDLDERVAIIAADIENSGSFRRPVVRLYPWTARYTARAYGELLNTYSDHLMLEQGVRRELLAAVEAVINEHGGVVDRPYRAVLFAARPVPKDNQE